MTDDLIPVTPVEQPQNDKIPVTTPSPPLSPDVAQDRATQATYGLSGKIDNTYNDYYGALISGQEEVLRGQIVTKLKERENYQRAGIVQALTQQKGSALSGDEYDLIERYINDPRSVIEDHFSQKYMDKLNWSKNPKVNAIDENDTHDSWWRDEVPTPNPDVNIGTEYLARINFWRSVAQDAEDAVSRQSWIGRGWDELKNLTTVYPIWMMHVPGTSWANLPGSQQREAISQLMTMPYEDMKTKGLLFYNQLKEASPVLARQFVNNVIGMSRSDEFLQNALPLVGPGLEVSLGYNVAKGLIGGVTRTNATRVAVRQMIQQSLVEGGMSPEEAASAVAGDLGQATISRTLRTLVSRERNARPIEDAIAALPGIFRLGRQNLEAGIMSDARGSALGAGERVVAGTNALLEEYDKLITDFPEMITGLTRAEAIPSMAEATPEALAAAKQEVRKNFRRINDRIINISDPEKDPVTGHWYVHVDIGESPTDYFGNAGRAGQVAKDNGIAGHEILTAEGVPTRVGYRDKRFTETPKTMWRNKDHDIPVEVLPEEPNVGPDGRKYQKVSYEGKETYVPADELVTTKPKSQILQQGTGFYIRKTIPLPGISNGMRDYYAKLDTDQIPVGGMLNSFLARFRTPNETLSAWQNRNREMAVFGSSVLEKYAYAQAQAIMAIRPLVPFVKTSWDDFERVLNNARSLRNQETKKMGVTYNNIGELQFAYQREVGRLPDEQEIAAYFAFKRINEMDHVLRTISIVRNKVRLGTMSHRIFTVENGERVYSDWFDAIPMNAFPTGTSHTIAIIGDQKGKEIVRGSARSFGKKQLADIVNKINNGELQIARLYAPSQQPLSGWGKLGSEHQPVYIISKNLETKNIDWENQLPFQGGGHFIYKYDHWIKQISVRAETVDGVTKYHSIGVNTAMPVANSADGEAIIKHLNRVRELLGGKLTVSAVREAKDIVQNTLKMPWEDVYGWFRSRPVKSGPLSQYKSVPPIMNTTEPFKLVRSNQNLLHLTDPKELEQRYAALGGTYHEAWRNGGDASLAHSVEFGNERDWDTLFTLNNHGTMQEPAYKWEPAKLLDAIPTMNRAFNKISNSFFMDDYKFGAIESWLKEATKYLDATENQIRSAPMYWFHHSEFKQGRTPDDVIKIKSLDVARQQMIQFMGQVSESDALVQAWTQKLSDYLYEKTPRLARMIDPAWTAHTLQDPTRFLRTITFHKSMGLFAIPQLLVQGNTYVTIMGLAGPVKAAQATTGALLHQWSRINANPAILQALDRYAQKLGWKPGEWLEAREALVNNGFGNVGSEYAARDNPMSNKVVQTRWGQFFDFGARPFTEGERNARFGSWYAAYKEFREKTPTGALSNKDKLEILNRASLLNGNMNRASNAMYQRGWAALPAQFLTYTIRQAELMWGKRLTAGEKARLLTANALMYGLPVGLGLTGLPSNMFRENAIANGYQPGENYVNTLITEGIPSTILGLTTGRYYNVGERYGTTGASELWDAIYNNKSAWDMALGASSSSLRSIAEAFDPFRQAMMSYIRQDDADYKITWAHVNQIAKEATSYNNGWKAVVAAKTGQWMTKQGEPLLRDIGPWEALFMFGTGLQPQKASDMYHMNNTMDQEKNVQQWAERSFIREFHRSLEAYDNDDPSNATAFMKNAYAYLHVYIPEDEWTRVLTAASRQFQTLIERTAHRFGTQHVPPELKGKRTDQYIQGIK